MSQSIQEAREIGIVATQSFLIKHRESIASAQQDVREVVASYARLHISDDMGDRSPSVGEILEYLDQTYIHLIERGVITFGPLTILGKADLANLRIDTGRVEAPIPQREPTTEELIYQQAKSDWNGGLSVDKIRKKESTNRAYAIALEKVIAATPMSNATSFHDNSRDDISSNPIYRRSR